ncbi:CocE/NonD family hydrolase [Parafrankia sp. FMc2]|uniref:CocE/NonD family hydrolase n=1 Tax=Parafrankia sp. FMc2 TaxID=3233196 RepID=UPI0034D79F23
MTTNVTVPMRDQTPLDCLLVRPAQDGAAAAGRFPGLVAEFTPYALIRSTMEGEAKYFAEHGYNVLVCNLRGTGASGGTWQHAMSSQDGRDAHDPVEWLATQPFGNGDVGIYGESYGGQTALGAAVEAPPHLRTAVPMQAPSALYDDVIYPGGVKTTERGTIDTWPDGAAVLSGGRIDADAEYAANRAHPTFDAYWQDRSFAGRYNAIRVPMLMVGGWNDQFFRAGTITNIENTADRTWAIYGPWAHSMPFRFASYPHPPAEALSPGLLLAWFDRWVKKLPNVPVPARPTFVSYEGPTGSGAGWRQLTRWVPAGTGSLVLSLGADATLTPVGGAGSGPGGTVSFTQPADPASPGGSATFTTAPLPSAQVLVGRPRLTLRATLYGPDANLYAELLDVAPDGTSVLVNNGFLRASHRSSHVTPTPVTPGQPTTFTVDIRAQHHRFAEGHRLALRLSGGAANTLTPNPSPVDVTLLVGISTLRLPGL